VNSIAFSRPLTLRTGLPQLPERALPAWTLALTTSTTPSQDCRPTWSGRLATFASDTLDAGRLFNAAAANHWAGQVAYLSSVVWGPVIAGIGMAVGGIEVATAISADTAAERRRRIVRGGLDMAISAAALVGTTGLNPLAGAVATTALVGVKLVYDMLVPRTS